MLNIASALYNFPIELAFKNNNINLQEKQKMDKHSIGWFAAIIIGGLAGWIAQNVMHTNTGIFLNIILGIVGASIATFILSMIGVHFAGWFGYLIAGFIGACALIFAGRQLGL